MRVYVAATRMNDGKTITALGLLSAIGDYYQNVGYIKPVGQKVQNIGGHQIDKDANLMNEVFQIGSQLYDMSPVAIPPGFTEEYILRGNPERLKHRLMQSFLRASRGKDFMVIEGTGHAGVGSVLDLSNAQVARLLNAPVVLVTLGGIGKPIDEVSINKALFDSLGVRLLGVVVNKVSDDKYEKIDRLVREGFRKKGIDVLGVVPFCPQLSSPSIRQLMEDIDGELLCGEKGLDQCVRKIIIGDMPPHSALEMFHGDELLITPGNREDLILAAMSGCVVGISKAYCVKGVILTGGITPYRTILRLVKRTNIPMILVKETAYEIAQKLHNLIVKLRPEDTEKIDRAASLIRQYVDVESIINKVKEFNKKRA
ncbi:MAG TPA: AAA family ATPase [Spirochaetota bacterium]|nr:AAA family ATPase [Spirochaetota bacterium]